MNVPHAALYRFWHTSVQWFCGWFEVVIGTAEFIDVNTINLVGSSLGPHWGPIVSKGLQIGCGLIVALRAGQAKRANALLPPGSPVLPEAQ